MTTAETAHIHALLEPDTQQRASGRPAPISNVMSQVSDWNAYRDRYITKHGVEQWKELNKPVKVNLDDI